MRGPARQPGLGALDRRLTAAIERQFGGTTGMMIRRHVLPSTEVVGCVAEGDVPAGDGDDATGRRGTARHRRERRAMVDASTI